MGISAHYLSLFLGAEVGLAENRRLTVFPGWEPAKRNEVQSGCGSHKPEMLSLPFPSQSSNSEKDDSTPSFWVCIRRVR